MNATLRRRVEMGERVQVFLRAHPTEGAETAALAHLEELLRRAKQLTDQQTAGASTAPTAPIDPQLTIAYEQCTYMHMRTTLIIDDGLLDQARQLTGIDEKTALVRAGLEALIAREAGRRLAALGGTMPELEDVPRRRPRPKRTRRAGR